MEARAGLLAPVFGETAYRLRVVWDTAGITKGGEWMTPRDSLTEAQLDTHRLKLVAAIRFASKEYGPRYPEAMWEACDEFMIDPPQQLAEYWDVVGEDDDDVPGCPPWCRPPLRSFEMGPSLARDHLAERRKRVPSPTNPAWLPAQNNRS